jgi:signal transduction histidine kinase
VLQQSVTLKSLSFRRAISLRSQVSIVTAILVFFTNFGMVSLALLLDPTPDYEVFHLRIQIALWLIVMSGSTSLIVYVFSRHLLLPLTNLNKQLLEVRGGGKRLRLEDIDSSSSAAEITVLRETLRELLGQIATEQSRRDAFIAALVHDLKTPLIATGHLLAMIEQDDTLPKKERIALIGNLHLETERLIDLVQKMVDAYKFERQDIQLHRLDHPLENIVATVIERVKPFAKQRSLHIQTTGQATAFVDPKELERGLYNLLTNATRYAHQYINIAITANCIRISDDGPGLPQSLDALARPFNGQPTNIAGQRYATGTGGLGLFIAKSILEAHGGHLADESANGTTVLAAYFI